MLAIHFKDVGGNKVSWDRVFAGGTLYPEQRQALLYAIREDVRRSGALISPNIGIVLDFETGQGLIYAGVREVGIIEARVGAKTEDENAG